MVNKECKQLKEEYIKIKDLFREFSLLLEQSRKIEDLEKIKRLKEKIEEMIFDLKDKLLTLDIRGSWLNPQTEEKKEISFSIREEIQKFADFYKRHLGMELNRADIQTFRDIWQSYRERIKMQIESYGYDFILFIPAKLPSLAELNAKLIETMNAPGGMVGPTEGIEKFLPKSKQKARTETKARLLLTKSAKELDDDPLLKATLGKNILMLSEHEAWKVKDKIKQGSMLSVSFEAEINGQRTIVMAEGFSLAEYFIFQRMSFDQDQVIPDRNRAITLINSALLDGGDFKFACVTWDHQKNSFQCTADSIFLTSGVTGMRLSYQCPFFNSDFL